MPSFNKGGISQAAGPFRSRDGLSSRSNAALPTDQLQLRVDPIHGDLDDEISSLQRKLSQLKDVAEEMGSEAKFQNKFLTQMILVQLDEINLEFQHLFTFMEPCGTAPCTVNRVPLSPPSRRGSSSRTSTRQGFCHRSQPLGSCHLSQPPLPQCGLSGDRNSQLISSLDVRPPDRDDGPTWGEIVPASVPNPPVGGDILEVDTQMALDTGGSDGWDAPTFPSGNGN